MLKFVFLCVCVCVCVSAAPLSPGNGEKGLAVNEEEFRMWEKTKIEYESRFTYPRSLKNKNNRACPSSPLSPGQTRITTSHDGRSREYVVHIPTNYNNSVNLPLVFDNHGYTNTAETQARYSNFRSIADSEHFVVVHPEGTGFLQSWNGGDCCVGNRQDDIGFFLRMIEEIADEYACVDLKRVYSGGYSNGGFMSHYLGCQTDAFAAIGPVAGCVTRPCPQTSHPVAMQQIHGTADNTIPYNGNFAYESAPVSQSTWADVNSCGNQEQVVYQHLDTTCVSRYNCANLTSPAESVLCTVQGAGHQYDFTSRGINSGEATWDFYKKFALP